MRGATSTTTSVGCTFVSIGGSPDAALRLICFPYGGGSAAVFRPFAALASRLDVHVVAVDLPGHGRTLGEPLEIDAAAIADRIAELSDGPFAMFGHSLGARLGFGVTRALVARHGRAPQHLFVSGAPAPRLRWVNTGDARLDDDAFIARISSMGGTPAAVLSSPELCQLFLPVLRFDFAWAEDDRYVPGPPLDIPVTALYGTRDPEVSPEQIAAWQIETSGAFRSVAVDGDHFFVLSDVTSVLDAIVADLSPEVGVARPAGSRTEGNPRHEH